MQMQPTDFPRNAQVDIFPHATSILGYNCGEIRQGLRFIAVGPVEATWHVQRAWSFEQRMPPLAVSQRPRVTARIHLHCLRCVQRTNPRSTWLRFMPPLLLGAGRAVARRGRPRRRRPATGLAAEHPLRRRLRRSGRRRRNRSVTGGWAKTASCQPAEAQDFRAADDAAMPTVVFIHGNNTDADEAVMKGWYVYESIRSQVGDKAFRYVIWSWPADRLQHVRNRRNTRLKAGPMRRGELLPGRLAGRPSAGREGVPGRATASARGSSPAPCTCWPAANWRARRCPPRPWPPGPGESGTRCGRCCWPRRWTPIGSPPAAATGWPSRCPTRC